MAGEGGDAGKLLLGQGRVAWALPTSAEAMFTSSWRTPA